MNRQQTMTVLAPVIPDRLEALKKRLDDAQRYSYVDDKKYPCPFKKPKNVHFARWAILNAENGSEDSKDTETYLLFATVYDGELDKHIESIYCINEKPAPHADTKTAVDLIFKCCEDYPADASPDKKFEYLRRHSTRMNALFIGAVGRTVEQITNEDKVRRHLNELTRNRERGLDLDQPEKLHESAVKFLRKNYREDWDKIKAAVTPGARWTHKVAEFLYKMVSDHWRMSLAAATLLVLGFCYWVFGRQVTSIVIVAVLAIVYFGLRFIRRLERGDDKLRAQWQRDEQKSNKRRRETNKTEKDERRKSGKTTADGSEVRKHEVAVIRGSEDRGSQNPLTSMIAIKRGGFRRRFLTFILYLTDVLSRTVFVRGSLAGLESIHFGRWAIVKDSKYLLFLSDYDGSWESYLGDFISEAPEGVTSIWTNAVYFPRTRYLVSGGVTDEHAFKSYGRYMMSETHYFFSAYPDLSLKNILQNSQICAGLLDKPLSPEELKEWAHLVARRAA